MLVDLNRRVQARVAYIVRMEPGVWTPEETLGKGQRLLPRFRLAAGADAAPSRLRRALRLRLPDPARAGREAADGPEGPTADFTDLHAWAEVYLPGAGWVGLDATSGLMAGEGHIPLAASPDPVSAAPISGLVGEGGGHVRLRDDRDARAGDAAHDQALSPSSNGRTSWPPAGRSIARSNAATCA